MLLVYTPRLTNRLGYTLGVLLQHLLRTEYSITTDQACLLSYNGPRLCYSPQRIGDALHIKCGKLLFETSITDQEPHPTQSNGVWKLFPVYGRDLDFDFDILAATFYLVSRYEEYLPHRTDQHGRFTAEQSVAAQAGFLDKPVVEHWATLLRQKLNAHYPELSLQARSYTYVQTIDIDAAWCYLHKGLLRSTLGIGRDMVGEHNFAAIGKRWRVLLKKEVDPFDTFDYIIDQHSTLHNSHLVFFALMADYSRYDKPSSYLNPHTRELLQHLSDHAKMGIHPGYYSIDKPQNVDVEMRRLEQTIHRNIVRARYHFLRLRLPHSYRILLHAGIKHDYTMGYADAIGFRASISVPYPFYDIERDIETELTIHPFCAMDTTLQQYLHLQPEQAAEQYHRLIDSVKAVGGNYSCICHNQHLGEVDGWQGWRNVYEDMIHYAEPNDKT